MRKSVRGDLHLRPRNNHAGYIAAAVRPEDETAASIPGLTVELELKIPLRVDACKNTASIYLLRSGVKYRVYQIEIQPVAKRSHNAPGNIIYGPHEHIGDQVKVYEGPPLSCSTPIEPLFQIFCRKANIGFTGNILLP